MSVWNEGLENSEIQKLHKLLKINMNCFLNDILNDEEMFKVEDNGDYYNIYPLFYCDKIETDGNALIIDTYKITCRKNYEQILMFISDTLIVTQNTYIIKKVEDNYIIFIFDEVTLQPSRNSIFRIEYENGDVEQFVTDKLGYCIFKVSDDDFEVVL